MSKLTFPIEEIVSTGNLCNLYDDLKKTYTGISETVVGTNRVLQDSFSNLTLSQLLSILNNGGAIEQHLMAIRVPASFMGSAVLAGLPNRTNPITASVKNYEDWFDSTAEVWKKSDDLEYIFFTNPHGNSVSEYLTGEKIKDIRDSDPTNISVLTITEAGAETAAGWTKL